MKAKFIVGMMIAMTFTTGNAMAAGAAKVNVRDALVDYTAKVKAAAFGKATGATGLSGQSLTQARNMIIKEIELPGNKNASLNMSLGDSSKVSSRLDALAVVVAAKKMSKSLETSDAVQAKSISEAADAAALLIANSALTGNGVPKELSQAEFTLTSSALKKMETLPEAILTSFEGQSRDTVTSIIKRHDQLVESGSKSTSEEAFIQAIMDIKKVDKKAALEMAKKLENCVI